MRTSNLDEKIFRRYQNWIVHPNDLLGEDQPSPLFYLLGNIFANELNPEKCSVSKKSIRRRQRLNCVFKKAGKHFLSNPQIIENRISLLHPEQVDAEDVEISLPNEPVIWMSNHAFKDDVLATILAAKRQGYILFGSLPQFFNTFDGITAWINGSILVNRKVMESKKSSTEKCVRVLELGGDLIIFPEGVWNKTPNLLALPFWEGIYRVANETGTKIVPIVHYIRDENNESENNPIHTVVDDPVDISGLDKEEALKLLRDKMAGWFYLMMERYGQSTRREEINGCFSSNVSWEERLKKRLATVDRYDMTIETSADFQPKWIRERKKELELLSSIKDVNKFNAKMIADFYLERKLWDENDFQHKF